MQCGPYVPAVDRSGSGPQPVDRRAQWTAVDRRPLFGMLFGRNLATTRATELSFLREDQCMSSRTAENDSIIAYEHS